MYLEASQYAVPSAVSEVIAARYAFAQKYLIYRSQIERLKNKPEAFPQIVNFSNEIIRTAAILTKTLKNAAEIQQILDTNTSRIFSALRAELPSFSEEEISNLISRIMLRLSGDYPNTAELEATIPCMDLSGNNSQ